MQVFTDLKWGDQTPWNWSHKLLWAFMWVLGTELNPCALQKQ